MMYCIQVWTLPTLLSLLAMVGSSAVSRWLAAISAYCDCYWLYANKRLRALKNEVRLDVLYILTHETMGPYVGIMDTQRKLIRPVYWVGIIIFHFLKLSSRPCKKPNICSTRFCTILIPLSRWPYSSSNWFCVFLYLCSCSLYDRHPAIRRMKTVLGRRERVYLRYQVCPYLGTRRVGSYKKLRRMERIGR